MKTEEESTAHPYRPELDGLRAVAIAVVMLHHYLPQALPFDGMGVVLFLVLSSYFGTRALLGLRGHLQGEAGSVRRALGHFYGRRYLRILPPHLLLLLVTAWFAVPYARETWGWNLFFLSNVGMLVEREWFGRFSPLWSLAVLEQFYWVWPVMVLLLPARWVGVCVIAMIPVALIYLGVMLGLHAWAGINVWDLWWFATVPGQMDVLGLGALLAYWRWRPGAARRLHLLRRMGLWVGGLAVVGFVAVYFMGVTLPGRVFYFSLGVGLFAVWLIDKSLRGMGGVGGWFLRLPWVAAAGRVSYAAFLFHNFTELLLLPVPWLGAVMATGWKPVILIPFTFLLAQLSWVGLERPISEYRKRRFSLPDRSVGVG